MTDANIPGQIALMLPPELVAGRPMDLNRPFGNGRDDDTDYVVDEADEDESTNGQWTSMMNVPSSYKSSPILGNLTNGIQLASTNMLSDNNPYAPIFMRDTCTY